MISKEQAFDIARQVYPDNLAFAALYAEGYYDCAAAQEATDLANGEKGAGWTSE